MYYIEESSYGKTEISVESLQLTQRKLFLGDITRDTSNEFVKQMSYLSSSAEPINIYINSNGGEINAGLVIYDLVQSSKAPINMYCVGAACSMAAVILAAGWKGRRFILPHSKVMIHEPLIANGVGGSATSISRMSSSILETRDLINQILAEHTGKTIEEINSATSFDNMMNAKQAVEFGICDKIVDGLF